MQSKISILILSVLTLSIYWLLPYDSTIVELVYSNFLFSGIRYIVDYSIGLLPFPSIYILIGLLCYLLIKFLLKLKAKVNQGLSWTTIMGSLMSDLAIFIGLVLISFYWLWGFNYKRVDFMTKNELVKQDITEDWLFQKLEKTQKELLIRIDKVDNLRIHKNIDKSRIELDTRSALESVLTKCGYKGAGRVRVRSLRPKGTLLIWSTAGVYLPFVSEGHIDAGLHPLTQPFTIAHEMSHGYGITEESTCNFTAMLTCLNSDNVQLQYSGYLGFFRYLMSACRRTNVERYKCFLEEELDNSIRYDLNEIYKELDKYPDILPHIRNMIYNSYLKSHGIPEGTVNYGMMIHLAAAWESQKGDFKM